MKKSMIIILMLLNLLIANNFGFAWDDRKIIKKENIIFEYKGNDNYAYIEGKKYLFDIFIEDGGLMDVKVLFKDKEQKVWVVLIGTYNSLKSPPDFPCDKVSAMWYKANLYKRYKNFMLKLLMNDDFIGHDGDVMCEKNIYLYKTEKALSKKINSIKITNKLILSSLEAFVNPNYSQKYESKFTFKDSTFNLDVLKSILNDISVNKKTLTPYNNIAYYLQKANANQEAIYLLKKILEKYPNRTVAHYNIADAYWVIDDKKKAKEHYNIYIKQMKAKGKSKRIPKVVKDRVASK